MSEQINLRLPDPLLKHARQEAKQRGFRSVQAFIEECIREEVEYLSEQDTKLIKKFIDHHDKNNLWVPKEKLLKKLRKKTRK